MNPMYLKVAQSLLRYALIAIGASGIISDDQLGQLTGTAVTLGTLLWSIWKNYKEQQTLVTALASPHPITEHEAEAMVKDPGVITPSVTSPKDQVPV